MAQWPPPPYAIDFRLSSGEMLWLFIITFNEVGLCFWEFSSTKLVSL